MEEKSLSKMIEKDNDELSERRKQYENNAAEVRNLNEKLQKKREQCDTFIKLLHMKQKEIKKLDHVFKEMMQEKEEEIEQLEKELSMRKEELSEYSARILNLQKELDKKTVDYELISGKVAQLEIERDDQEKRFELMQTEYEQKLQLEAARTLGAEEHAKEVEVCMCFGLYMYIINEDLDINFPWWSQGEAKPPRSQHSQIIHFIFTL